MVLVVDERRHHSLVDGDSGGGLIGSLDRLAVLEASTGGAPTTVTTLGSLVSVDASVSVLEVRRGAVLEGGAGTTLLGIDKLGSDSDLVLLQGGVHGISSSKVDIGAVPLLGKVKTLDGTKLAHGLTQLLLGNPLGDSLDIDGEELVTAIDFVGSTLLLLLLLGLGLGHNLGLGGSRLGNVDGRSLGSRDLGAPLVRVVGSQVGPCLGLGRAGRDGGRGGSLDNRGRCLGDGSSSFSSSSGSTVLLLGGLSGLRLLGDLSLFLGGILLGLLLVALLVVLLVLVLLLGLLLLDGGLLLLNYGLGGWRANNNLGLGGRRANGDLRLRDGSRSRGADGDLGLRDGSRGANGDLGLISRGRAGDLRLHLLLLVLLDDLSLDLRVVLEVTENVVQDVETLGLLGQEEGLDELLGRAAPVGHLSEDLDHDSSVQRGLAVDVADQDLAVLEIQSKNLGVNALFGAKV